MDVYTQSKWRVLSMFMRRMKATTYATLLIALLFLSNRTAHAQQAGLWESFELTSSSEEPGFPIYVIRNGDCPATLNFYISTDVNNPTQTFLGQESGQVEYPGDIADWPSTAVLSFTATQAGIYYFSAQVVSGTCTVDPLSQPPTPSTTPWLAVLTIG
jgi:hypothetical protein